jgi:DNA-binding MarR family transcriptional regulator
MADRRANNLNRELPLYEGQEDLKLRTWVQLIRTFYLVQRRVVVALSARELTLPQFDVMATLRFGENATQQELAERLLVTKGNVCGVVTRLEACGWVERRPDPDDGRANRLRLTPAGRRKIESVLPEHDTVVLQALSPLSVADAKSLRGLLEEVARANEDPA